MKAVVSGFSTASKPTSGQESHAPATRAAAAVAIPANANRTHLQLLFFFARATGRVYGSRRSFGITTDLVAAGYSGVLPQDVFPAVGSGLIGAANPSWRAVDDFNLSPRATTDDMGAYPAAAGGNPGWALAAGFKPSRWIFDDGFELESTVEWSEAAPSIMSP